jgi:ketosteroid isomerase-like protein
MTLLLGTATLNAQEPTSQPSAQDLRAEVSALFDAWLNAQNEGDLERYDALYATRFQGIKRVGARTFSYDRTGWMADRGRMFGSPMTVTAADIEIRGSGSVSVVYFTQTWTSGTYQDQGPKQLVIVREGSELRISREEMLSSEILSSAGALIDLNRRNFVPVIEVLDECYVVLSSAVEAAWASETIESVERGFSAIAVARELPTEVSNWRGQRVRYRQFGGGAETAEITALFVISRVYPHFGSEQEWSGEWDDLLGDAGRRWTDAEVAVDVFNQGDQLLVGRLETCAGPGFAQTEASAEPLIYAPMPSTPVRDAVLAELEALGGYAEIQEYFRSETGEAGPWYRFEGAEPDIRLFADTETGRSFASVAVRSGTGCGDFSGDFWALFEVRPDGRLQLLTSPDWPGDQFSPDAVFDADGDGHPEFMNRERVIQWSGEVYRQTFEIEVPDYDCPC